MPSTDFLVFSKMCSGDYKKEFFVDLIYLQGCSWQSVIFEFDTMA